MSTLFVPEFELPRASEKNSWPGAVTVASVTVAFHVAGSA